MKINSGACPRSANQYRGAESCPTKVKYVVEICTQKMYIISVADKHYYGFVWDENKAAINKQKHGISFETAVLVFQDPMLLEIYDINSSGDEDRYDVIGSVLGRLITFVVYTERNQEKRIISARPATSFERKKYYENIASL